MDPPFFFRFIFFSTTPNIAKTKRFCSLKPPKNRPIGVFLGGLLVRFGNGNGVCTVLRDHKIGEVRMGL